MSKAITIGKITIKCDSCDFSTEGIVEEWHNNPCPKCGAENIVNDFDMELYHNMTGLIGAVNDVCGDVKDQTSVTVAVDSAGFKERPLTNPKQEQPCTPLNT
jgi:predicted RNA-binding Zn-ribbon protein involved in translation (DUF1610 family)